MAYHNEGYDMKEDIYHQICSICKVTNFDEYLCCLPCDSTRLLCLKCFERLIRTSRMTINDKFRCTLCNNEHNWSELNKTVLSLLLNPICERRNDNYWNEICEQMKQEVIFVLDDLHKRKELELILIDRELERLTERLKVKRDMLRRNLEKFYKNKDMDLNVLLNSLRDFQLISSNNQDNFSLKETQTRLIDHLESILNYSIRFVKTNSIDLGHLTKTMSTFNGLDCQYTYDGLVQDITCSKDAFYTLTKEDLSNNQYLYRISRKAQWNGDNLSIIQWKENSESTYKLSASDCLFLMKISPKMNLMRLLQTENNVKTLQQNKDSYELENIQSIPTTDGVVNALKSSENYLYILRNNCKLIEKWNTKQFKKLYTTSYFKNRIIDMRCNSTSDLILLLENGTILRLHSTSTHFDRNEPANDIISFQKQIVYPLCNGSILLNENCEFIHVVNVNKRLDTVYPFDKVFHNCKQFDYHLTVRGVIFYIITTNNILIVRHFRGNVI
ncbi:unnamed protein product [Dimorphilus gyrociliatus]|uniref:Uncharacterized protein n=1 Tax=Dimorphilus gyrociliatus TaxID=2664684 RepID=A0A7I8VAS6_9ANNE|nr:unnamed protein product [Dimorphilus gyrociliatus]